jgi:hypothetical protein
MLAQGLRKECQLRRVLYTGVVHRRTVVHTVVLQLASIDTVLHGVHSCVGCVAGVERASSINGSWPGALVLRLQVHTS